MRAERPDPLWIALTAAAAGLLAAGAPAREEARSEPALESGFAVYLVAARQKGRIAESLSNAGLRVVDDILDSPALLRVTVGNEKGFQRCGTRNNVKYALHVGGAQVLELTEAGWTGTCEPNVFDELSARLARALSETDR